MALLSTHKGIWFFRKRTWETSDVASRAAIALVMVSASRWTAGMARVCVGFGLSACWTAGESDVAESGLAGSTAPSSGLATSTGMAREEGGREEGGAQGTRAPWTRRKQASRERVRGTGMPRGPRGGKRRACRKPSWRLRGPQPSESSHRAHRAQLQASTTPPARSNTPSRRVPCPAQSTLSSPPSSTSTPLTHPRHARRRTQSLRPVSVSVPDPAPVLLVARAPWTTDRKSTRLNSSHSGESRMPSSA